MPRRGSERSGHEEAAEVVVRETLAKHSSLVSSQEENGWWCLAFALVHCITPSGELPFGFRCKPSLKQGTLTNTPTI